MQDRLLLKAFIRSAFLYEPVAQWLSTPSAGEPFYQVPDKPVLRHHQIHVAILLFSGRITFLVSSYVLCYTLLH